MKKLVKYKKLVLKVKGDLGKLSQFGFKRTDVGGTTGEIFIHKKDKVVIKSNYLCSRKTPSVAIPTVRLKVRGSIINIQPLANVSKSAVKRAFDIFETTISYREYNILEDTFDLHDGNVGMFGKKAVMIDW